MPGHGRRCLFDSFRKVDLEVTAEEMGRTMVWIADSGHWSEDNATGGVVEEQGAYGASQRGSLRRK